MTIRVTRLSAVELLAAFGLALLATAPISFAADGPAAQTAGPATSQMAERMAAMHAQMEQIRQTKDPVQRRRLMQAHMQSMRDSMGMMRGMMNQAGMPCCAPGAPGQGQHQMGGMMGPGPAGGMMGNPPMAMTPDQMQQRHHQMEEMLSLHQQMMEQMLEHQQMMEAK